MLVEKTEFGLRRVHSLQYVPAREEEISGSRATTTRKIGPQLYAHQVHTLKGGYFLDVRAIPDSFRAELREIDAERERLGKIVQTLHVREKGVLAAAFMESEPLAEDVAQELGRHPRMEMAT